MKYNLNGDQTGILRDLNEKGYLSFFQLNRNRYGMKSDPEINTLQADTFENAEAGDGFSQHSLIAPINEETKALEGVLSDKYDRETVSFQKNDNWGKYRINFPRPQLELAQVFQNLEGTIQHGELLRCTYGDRGETQFTPRILFSGIIGGIRSDIEMILPYEFVNEKELIAFVLGL